MDDQCRSRKLKQKGHEETHIALNWSIGLIFRPLEGGNAVKAKPKSGKKKVDIQPMTSGVIQAAWPVHHQLFTMAITAPSIMIGDHAGSFFQDGIGRQMPSHEGLQVGVGRFHKR
jgi:hypothetical protein